MTNLPAPAAPLREEKPSVRELVIHLGAAGNPYQADAYSKAELQSLCRHAAEALRALPDDWVADKGNEP
jgi:hypothetical protein